MPITVRVPQGLLTSAEEEAIVGGLTDAVLNVNGVNGNVFAREHLIAALTTIPKRNLFRYHVATAIRLDAHCDFGHVLYMFSQSKP